MFQACGLGSKCSCQQPYIGSGSSPVFLTRARWGQNRVRLQMSSAAKGPDLGHIQPFHTFQLAHGRKSDPKSVCRAAVGAGTASISEKPEFDGKLFARVVFPTALALMLCNMDRICMSVAIMPMSQEFGWAPSMQGYIQSAFLWGYTATQLLGGTLADKYGGRVVIGCGIAWFSLASVLLPIALSLPLAAAGLLIPAVWAARCLVGVGEGVVMPAMNTLIAQHIPISLRSTALGNAYTGFHSGNLLGLVVSPLLLAWLGWRGLFLVFGAIGAPLILLWLGVVPKQPAAPSAAKLDASGGVAPTPPTTLQLMGKTATWAIIVVNVVNHWGYFIYLNWMPTYFFRVMGFNVRDSSLATLIPWVVMAVGSTVAGLIADSLIRAGLSVTSVRKGVQTVAFIVPAAALLVLSNPASLTPAFAVGCFTFALGMTSLGQAGFVANTSDIAPRYAGRLYGLCNTFGSLAGVLGVSAVGIVVEKTGSFNPIFQFTAGLYILGAIFWNIFCTAERVFD